MYLNIFGKKVLEFGVGNTKASRVQSLLASDYLGGPRWSDQNYETHAREAYLRNVISYRCINMIAMAIGSLNWDVRRRKSDGGEEQVNDHPLYDLMERPNPHDSFGFLNYIASAYLVMNGNTYYERVRPQTRPDAPIMELYVLRTDRTRPVVDKSGRITGYEYQVGARKVFFPADAVTGESDILHVKLFHPLDDWLGSSPVESTAREIDAANEAVTWQMRMYQNQARPGMLFFFGQQLGDQQFDRLKAQLREEFSGGMNAGRNMIIEGELTKAVPYSLTPMEMDFLESHRELARRICLGFGVPPQLLGIPGDNTYSNYEQARLAFWEDTVFFYLRLLQHSLSAWFLAPEPGLFLKPNLDAVPALEPRRKEAWEKANTANHITINEKRKLTGHETLDEGEGGDIVLVPTSLGPLKDVAIPPEIDPGDEEGMDEDVPPKKPPEKGK